MHIMDALIARIEQTGNPTAMGLDTRIEYIPEDLKSEFCPGGIKTLEDAAHAVLSYNLRLIEAAADLVPAVKVQAAYYEMYGVPGMAAFGKTLKAARAKGLIAIADIKRNDIGATAQAYSAAYLGETPLEGGTARAFEADIVTINPYLGSDGIGPFLKDMREYGKGAFALVKTSNPSSGELQDRMMGGHTLYEVVADCVNTWGQDLIGEMGYSALGAVVGATYPVQSQALRARMPHTFFLVPGYGAQGATAKDLAGCFDEQGRGAIVNASRSILCAWQKAPEMSWREATRGEVVRMREDIMGALFARKG